MRKFKYKVSKTFDINYFNVYLDLGSDSHIEAGSAKLRGGRNENPKKNSFFKF